jgi:hypothetical protein
MTPRSRAPTLLLAVAAAAASPGCKGKERRVAEETARALIGMAALPASIDQVIGVDVARLGRSPLVGRAVTALLQSDATLERELTALLDSCQIDVARDLRRLWLGMDRDGGDRVIVVIEGKLGEGQLAACVGAAIGGAGGRLTGERVAGRTHYHVDQGGDRPDVWFAVAGDGLVAVASSADFLAEATGEGPKLDRSAALAALIERAGPTHGLWFAGSVPAEVGGGLARASGGALTAPRAMFGHAELDGPLEAELGAEMASPAEAERAVSLVKPQLQTLALVAQARGLGRLVNRIAVEATGETLRFRLAVPEDEVRAVVGTTVDTGAVDAQDAAP